MSNRKIGYVSPIGEYNSPKFGVFVETAGYRTSKQQIESFVIAGERLAASRAGSYDSEDYEPVEDSSLEVRNYELSEIGEMMQPGKTRVKKVESGEEKPLSSPDGVPENVVPETDPEAKP